MKRYEEPNIEILFFETIDIVTVSGGLTNGGAGDNNENPEGPW